MTYSKEKPHVEEVHALIIHCTGEVRAGRVLGDAQVKNVVSGINAALDVMSDTRCAAKVLQSDVAPLLCQSFEGVAQEHPAIAMACFRFIGAMIHELAFAKKKTQKTQLGLYGIPAVIEWAARVGFEGEKAMRSAQLGRRLESRRAAMGLLNLLASGTDKGFAREQLLRQKSVKEIWQLAFETRSHAHATALVELISSLGTADELGDLDERVQADASNSLSCGAFAPRALAVLLKQGREERSSAGGSMINISPKELSCFGARSRGLLVAAQRSPSVDAGLTRPTNRARVLPAAHPRATRLDALSARAIRDPRMQAGTRRQRPFHLACSTSSSTSSSRAATSPTTPM
jgi:hypothetical protein